MAAGLMEEVGEDVSLVCYPDPFVLELNKLQNQLKEKERELGKARSEIKGLRATEVMKDRAVEEAALRASRLTFVEEEFEMLLNDLGRGRIGIEGIVKVD